MALPGHGQASGVFQSQVALGKVLVLDRRDLNTRLLEGRGGGLLVNVVFFGLCVSLVHLEVNGFSGLLLAWHVRSDAFLVRLVGLVGEAAANQEVKGAAGVLPVVFIQVPDLGLGFWLLAQLRL